MDYLRPQLKRVERTLFDISRDSCSPSNCATVVRRYTRVTTPNEGRAGSRRFANSPLENGRHPRRQSCLVLGGAKEALLPHLGLRAVRGNRSEEHTSELQSLRHLV